MGAFVTFHGKGKSTDIALLELLCAHRAQPIWQITRLDGKDQGFHVRRKRAGYYRRAIKGRKDSRQLGLLQRGLVSTSKQMINGKLRDTYSITKEGIRALVMHGLVEHSAEIIEGILQKQGADTLIKIAFEGGFKPVPVFQQFLERDILRGYADILEHLAKNQPAIEEIETFHEWLSKSEPDLYKKWEMGWKIDQILRGRSDLIEKIRIMFPLSSEKWHL